MQYEKYARLKRVWGEKLAVRYVKYITTL
jgi:hypothetical protein